MPLTTKRRRKLPPKAVYVGSWNDESANIRELVRDLKAYGVRAKSVSSAYVGMHRLMVNVEDVDKAKKALNQMGTDESNYRYIASDCLKV